MPTVTNTIEIKAGPDDVWAVLADLTATRHWLPGTVDASMDQDVWICRIEDVVQPACEGAELVDGAA